MKKTMIAVLCTAGYISTSSAELIVGQSVGIDFGGGSAGNGAWGTVTADNFTSMHENFSGSGAANLVLLSDGTTLSGVGAVGAKNHRRAHGFSNDDPSPGSGATAPFTDGVLQGWSGTENSGWTLTFSGLNDELTYTLDLAQGAHTIDPLNDLVQISANGMVVGSMAAIANEPNYQSFKNLATDGSGNLRISVDVDPLKGGVGRAILSGVVLTATEFAPEGWATLPADKSAPLDDADGDGYLNIEEYQFGTDPLVAGGVQGYLSYETWFDFGGYSVEALESLPEFRLQPDINELVAGAEAPVNIANNFGARLHGYIIAPEDGEYTFWVAGDDHFALYLSDSESKFGATKIAGGQFASWRNNFDVAPSQKSSPITLAACQKYYICGLMKEAGGGDHLSIAWQTPSGQREIIPASALESYFVAEDDKDNDFMSDTWEVANGLDTTVNDALSDPDSDNAPNWLEFQAQSDPQVKAPVQGGLVHELWADIPGRFVSDLTGSTKFLQTPDVKSISTWSAGPFGWGNNHGNRLRGYITPTESGNYSFWVEGEMQVEMNLSSNEDKFNAENIIRTVHFNRSNNFEFDYDIAQQSGSIYLEAGQAYYVEVLHKNLYKAYDRFSFAWTKPDGTRELVPSANLSTYAGQANDLDDDGLEDSWELANGLSTQDNGSIDPKNGAQGDLDGDGLLNYEEQAAGTRADLVDTNTNGVGDYDEVKVIESQGLLGDIAPFIEVTTISGASFTNPVGEWANQNGSAYHTSTRGKVDYTFNVADSGVYLLDLKLTPKSGSYLSDEYEVVYSVDGQKLDRVTVNVAEGASGNVKALTPYLTAGEHTVTVFLDNSYTYRKTTLDSLTISASAGTDANANGQPDWVDNRLALRNNLDGGALYSQVSPVFVEGNAQYVDLASSSWSSIQAAPGNRWFGNVVLDPSGAVKPVTFLFENGGHSVTKEFKWVPTNLLHETSLRVRQGSSLLLTASEQSEGSVNETVNITVNGEQYTFTADQAQQVDFNQPGVFTIDLTYQSQLGTQSKQIDITVLGDYQIAEEPVVVQDYWREWVVPALPENTSLELDEKLVVRDSEVLADGSIKYTLKNTGSENLPALVRDDFTGEVLGNFEVKGLRVRENGLTSVTQVSTNEDGSRNIEMPVIIDGSVSDINMAYDIFIGGVTFDDGTTSKLWELKSLQPMELPQHTVHFIKYGNTGSVCHRGSLFQNGVRIAHMY